MNRRPSDARDSILLPLAVRWYSELPADVQPEMLAAQFPGIINKLALAWPDAPKARALLEELLIDRRGGRSGFPSQVFNELLQLHGQLGEAAFDTASPDVWS
jgi:hypothetical protein